MRLLTKNDIECRVAQVDKNVKWCSVLLYKNARVDMNILDETYGPLNWQRHHEVIDGKLFCTVSVYDAEKKQWVSKQDVGVESNTEAEKGQASDAFKRACFNLGIGRELYTAPKIFINLGKSDLTAANKVRTHFYVKDIEYANSVISALTIVDDKGVVRYQWPAKSAVDTRAAAFAAIDKATTQEQLVSIFNNNAALQGDNSFINKLKERRQQINERA